MSIEVRAIGTRRNNAELIADCATLGYLRTADTVLDPTYGRGRFWTNWQPVLPVVKADLHYQHLAVVKAWDFTALPLDTRSYDAVTFDPPYKLNGTPGGRGAATSDESYGVHRRATWQERHQLIADGIKECARVAHRTLLIKCQDQVVSGRKRWQTRLFADHAEDQGFTLVDMLHVQGYRKQPDGRRQVHSRGDYSTLLVLERAT